MILSLYVNCIKIQQNKNGDNNYCKLYLWKALYLRKKSIKSKQTNEHKKNSFIAVVKAKTRKANLDEIEKKNLCENFFSNIYINKCLN